MTAAYFPSGLEIEPIGEQTVPDFRGSKFRDDGPETRMVIGRNQFLKTFSVTLKPLRNPEQKTVTEFLRARFYRNEWFWWSHPKRGPLRIKCRAFSCEPLGWGYFQTEMQLEEVVGL